MIPLRDNITGKTFPFINCFVIALNVYVFYVMLHIQNPKLLEAFVMHWAVVPSHLFSHFSKNAFTLVTAMFLHGGWLHIIFNMWFLYVFGKRVEDQMGHLRYTMFYFAVGIIAYLIQALFYSSSAIPMLGASGAIAGVLGSYFFFYPYARVKTLIPIWFFITIREIPAFIFLGIWFLLQTLNGTMAISSQVITKQSMGGVAWWAHAGGFVAGLILSPVFGRKQSKYR